MTDNDKCPPAKEVEDFLFKQASVGQICDEFQNIPINSSLITADGKRGLLYIGHETKLIVIKPGIDSNPEWKLELDLPDRVCRVALSCDSSFLAVTFSRPAALIYDATSIHKHKLDILHEIRLSATAGNVAVSDLKWNPAIPEMLCSITNDHTVGCFQVSRDKKAGVQIIGMERAQGLEALCVSWSPKGKQLVVGCKNGDIVQLKPELKVARHLPAPNPSEGVIIAILWVSNYQFCACYFHTAEQRVSIMIVDAPKGATVAKFTNYEDITFGTGSLDGLCYYFEHIAEWGIIITASSHSSEVAVMGTADNGATWNQWQLMDDSTAQLPLNRKKETENYPVGVAIDKSTTHKLPWGSESTLPNPVPILRILVTSGQLCCYHMVNLKANTPAICAPPTENVPTPALPRPSLGPSEVSFNLGQGATSTPRSKQIATETHVDRPKLSTHMFGDNSSSSSSFSFLAPGNRGPSEIPPQTEIKNIAFSAPAEIKTGGFFGQGDGKTNSFQQENKINKPAFMPEPNQQIKQSTPILQQPTVQVEPKAPEFSLKPDNRTEFKVPGAQLPSQAESKVAKERPKDPPQYHSEEVNKTAVKEAPVYDDGLCLRAYYEEQARFEKELKSRLDLPTWNCGTEEERHLLIKKSDEIDEFLRELRETTNSLASDIAYLKALLLQSFAWIEETKSKNSANVSISGRNRADGNKLADLQRLYYYTQSQLIQATKVLDLEWAEHKNRETSRMKIPSLEVIYQSLIRYSQIIGQEKKNMEDLTKKWRVIARGGAGGNSGSLSILDRSMASLNLSRSSSAQVNDTAIDLRCKFIASNTRNFSREKQTKLRDLLSESAPRIVRAVRPTAVQDRLEATLSSLASLKTTEATAKAKANKSALEVQRAEAAKSKAHNPLSSLDNLVSGISGGMPALSKSPSSVTPFSTFGTKPSFVPSAAPHLKSKENVATPFAQSTGSPQLPQAPAGLSKAFGKIDSISFGSSPAQQKTPDLQASKENLAKLPTPVIDPTANKFSVFSSTFGKSSSTENPLSMGATSPTLSNMASVPKSTFSFSSSTTSAPTPQSFASVPKLDNAFKFSTKPAGTAAAPQQTPPAQGGLDLSALSFGGTRQGLSITTTVSDAKNPSTQQQQQQQQQSSIFGQSTGLSTAPPIASAAAAGLSLQSLFGKSSAAPTAAAAAAPAPAAAVSSSDKAAAVSSSVPANAQATITSTALSAAATGVSAAPTSVFGSSSMFGGLSASIAPTSAFDLTSASTGAATPATTATSAPSLSFGGLSSTTPSSSPGFAGMLGATASLSFGTPASTGPSISAAFGKSTAPPTSNIFGSTTPAVAATASPAAGTSIFGKSDGNAVSSSSSPFGGATSTATTTTPTSTSVFGNIAASAPGASIFGGQTAVSSTSSSTENSFFSAKPAAAVAPAAAAVAPVATTATAAAPTSSIFGGSTTSTPNTGSMFGSSTPVFATSAPTTQQSNVFGVSSTTPSSTTPSSGTSIFGGGTATPSSVFGSAGSSVFGGASTASTAASTTSASTPSTGSVFGGASTNTGSIFGGGAAPASNTSVFGASAAPTGSIFGTAATTTTVTTPPSGSIFGSVAASPQPAAGSVFGAAAAAAASPAAGSIFGGGAAMGAGSMFGGATSPTAGMGAPSVFGQASAFGAKPVFGSPTADFGAAKTGFGTGFGSPPAFGTAPTAGFGSPSMLGAGSPLGGTSPSKVFGSSTFEALGAQSGGLSFGSLAQKTPEPEKQQTFQGSSSFSSWR